MTNSQQLLELLSMTGSRGWKEILVPIAQARYEDALDGIMNTPGQTDANIHKAAGLASAYSFILKGIPEMIQMLQAAVEEENRPAGAEAESAPPIM